MKRFFLLSTATAFCVLAACIASAGWVYEGQWGCEIPVDVIVLQDNYLFVLEWYEYGMGGNIAYFSPTGSRTGEWRIYQTDPFTFAISPIEHVYVGYSRGIAHYGNGSSLIGSWGYGAVRGIAVAPTCDIYATGLNKVFRFTATGSMLGEWGGEGTGDGEFNIPYGVALAPNNNVYVADSHNHRVQYFNSIGSFLGKWGTYGYGDGQFRGPSGIAVSSDGYVYVVDTTNDRVQYFTLSGSFVGKFGGYGTGEGKLFVPLNLAFSNDGQRLYVADTGNELIQYFRKGGTAVVPSSLGRVKALFH